MKYTTIDDIDNSVLELALAFEKIPMIKSRRFWYKQTKICYDHQVVKCELCSNRLSNMQPRLLEVEDDATEVWKLRLKIAGKLLKTSPGTETNAKLQAQDDILNELFNIFQGKINNL